MKLLQHRVCDVISTYVPCVCVCVWRCVESGKEVDGRECMLVFVQWYEFKYFRGWFWHADCGWSYVAHIYNSLYKCTYVCNCGSNGVVMLCCSLVNLCMCVFVCVQQDHFAANKASRTGWTLMIDIHYLDFRYSNWVYEIIFWIFLSLNHLWKYRRYYNILFLLDSMFVCV